MIHELQYSRSDHDLEFPPFRFFTHVFYLVFHRRFDTTTVLQFGFLCFHSLNFLFTIFQFCSSKFPLQDRRQPLVLRGSWKYIQNWHGIMMLRIGRRHDWSRCHCPSMGIILGKKRIFSSLLNTRCSIIVFTAVESSMFDSFIAVLRTSKYAVKFKWYLI